MGCHGEVPDCQFCSAALAFFEQDSIKRNSGLLHSLCFIDEAIIKSQAQDFNTSRAIAVMGNLEEKLIVATQTGNPFAIVGLEKFQQVRRKNAGLTPAINLSNGIGIKSPMDVPIFTFSPVTSVNVERLFSVLKSWVGDWPYAGRNYESYDFYSI